MQYTNKMQWRNGAGKTDKSLEDSFEKLQSAVHSITWKKYLTAAA